VQFPHRDKDSIALEIAAYGDRKLEMRNLVEAERKIFKKFWKTLYRKEHRRDNSVCRGKTEFPGETFRRHAEWIYCCIKRVQGSMLPDHLFYIFSKKESGRLTS